MLVFRSCPTSCVQTLAARGRNILFPKCSSLRPAFDSFCLRHFSVPSDVSIARKKKRVQNAAEVDRAGQLRGLITSYNESYYQHGVSLVSDLEYDRLFRELQELEERFPELRTPSSPTNTVGSKISSDGIKHRLPMLSLESIVDLAGLSKFDDTVSKFTQRPIRYVLEKKYDGMAVSLVYKNGLLFTAVSRGDGERGDAITEQVRALCNYVPERIAVAEAPDLSSAVVDLEVRGEVVMSKRNFTYYADQRATSDLKQYSSARNLVAGMLRRGPSEVQGREGRCLDFFCYSMHSYSLESALSPTMAGSGTGLIRAALPDSHFEQLQLLQKFGFQPDPEASVYPSMELLQQSVPALMVRRHELAHQIDGFVVKANDDVPYCAVC